MMIMHHFYIVLLLYYMPSKNSVTAISPIIPSDTDHIKLVIVGMRHANRNPEVFLQDDPNKNTWGWEGPLQLNKIGKEQSYSFGQLLRSRYTNVIPQIYTSEQLQAVSSSADRCQMSLQTTLNSLYPPINYSIWDNNVTWQPIPYSINDQLLRLYKVSECTTQAQAWKPITDDNLPELREWLQRDKVIMDYISKHTGLNSSSISDMADVADNLKNMQSFGYPLPDWVSHPTLTGYNQTSMVNTIMSFAEAHQIACANYQPCKNIMAGYWLGQIVNALKNKIGGNKLKLIFYASHTEIVLSLMKLLHYDINKCPASAGFIIEYAEFLQNNKTIPKIRFLYHHPVEGNAKEHAVQLATSNLPCTADTDHWCEWSQVLTALTNANVIINDWKQACNIQSCTSSSGASLYGVPWIFIIIGYMHMYSLLQNRT